MPGSPRAVLAAGAGALAFGSAALVPVIGLWGYTVDDALIIARVAAELAHSGHYRFNPSGPAVDAVTPLGWPWLFVPIAGSGVLEAFAAAKLIGALSWVAAAALLGWRVQHSGGSRLRYAPLGVVALCAPLAAWAVSGMETGVVTLLATLAVLLAPGPGSLCAGAAAALRPELVPWAAVLALGLLARPERPSSFVLALARGVAPALGVALLRLWLFGRPLPLSAAAKPADLQQGAWYALEALLRSGPPLLVMAPLALKHLPRRERIVLLAAAVHVLAMALAGGDWMALYRLIVPVLPSLLWVGARIAAEARPGFTLLRTALGVLVAGDLLLRFGSSARHVGPHRLALIEGARAPLRDARSVAAVDVGWVGAATPAPIVDLAGVTDPRIAVLPGSHTSKRIPPGLLAARRVDRLVLLLEPGAPLAEPWYESRFARAVEHRLARSEADLGFRVESVLPLGGTTQRYVVLARPAQPVD